MNVQNYRADSIQKYGLTEKIRVEFGKENYDTQIAEYVTLTIYGREENGRKRKSFKF